MSAAVRGDRTLVKICGLCSAGDAASAVDAGADAVGVVLAPVGPRHVLLDEARRILADVPDRVRRVGVFVDPTADDIEAAVEALGLGAVQLHGHEPPEFCDAVPAPVIKAFRVGAGFDRAVLEPYRGRIRAALLDTFVPGMAGGTGRAFPWEAAADMDGLDVWLAGGLTPANVGEAVRAARPRGVDVSSGVESGPRRKDRALVAAFVAAVRANDEEMGT